jgi:hypothetical protein
VGFIEQELKEEKEQQDKIKNNSTDYVKSVYPYINAARGRALEDKCGETLLILKPLKLYQTIS